MQIFDQRVQFSVSYLAPIAVLCIYIRIRSSAFHCVPLCSIVFHCVPLCSSVFQRVPACSSVIHLIETPQLKLFTTTSPYNAVSTKGHAAVYANISDRRGQRPKLRVYFDPQLSDILKFV